jgi:acetyltransferase
MQVLSELAAGQYSGAIYPVHPTASSFGSLPAFPSLAELPTVPDVLVIARPAATVPALAVEAAKRGVRGLVVMSSGFGELGTEEGHRKDAALRLVADQYGLAICGPNSLGLINAHTGAYLSNFAPLERRRAKPGGLAIVSHSGALAGSLIGLALDRGVGLSYAISGGNELTLTAADYVRHLAHDARVTSLSLYLEGATDGRALIDAVAEATAAGKPVVALKVGDSPSGARAALSHTAKISGEQNLYQAALEQAGASLAHSLEELVQLPMYRENVADPTVPPRRACIISLSGGLGAAVADEFSRAGIDVPELQPRTRAALAALDLPLGGTSNPVDTAGATQRSPQSLGDIVAAAAADPQVDVVALTFPSRFQSTAKQTPELVSAIHATLTKPLVAIWIAGSENAEAIGALRDRGVACFESPAACARALSAASRFAEHLASERQPLSAPPVDLSARGWLSEPATKALLRHYDIDTAREGLVASAEEAERLAADFGYPVALKVASPDIVHKAAAGGVRLGITDVGELHAAFAEMHETLRRTSPGARIEGLLVGEMVGVRSEYIIGSYVDETFGPVLAFGKGGSRVEQESKPQLRLLPMTVADCADAVDRALTDMGECPSDVVVEGLRAAVAAVARFATAAGDRLLELDVNPMIVSTDDRVLALDAVAHFKESD